MNKLQTIVAATVFASIAAPAHSQIVNGGFETGTLSGWSTAGTCNFTMVDGPSAHSGSFGLAAGPTITICTISQNIATTVGQQYSFSFWLRSDGGSISFFDASFGGTSVFQLNNSPTLAYTFESFFVTATSSTTNVAFQFRHDPAFWHLDDVSVTTPEPSSIFLMATGLIGLGVVVVRRRRA